jgi:biopolymer transport protein ExbB/TolQ
VSSRLRLADAVVRSPILWGAAASAGFFGLVHSGLLGDHFFQRYCAGHQVNYVETILFWMGAAILAIKAIDLAAQRAVFDSPAFGAHATGGRSPTDSAGLLAQLTRVHARRPDHYLVRRLRDGLEFIRRRETVENLDDHLKHLSDLDADRAHAGYALLRLIVWAIPILGFLGTVIGITMAIASLKPTALEESMLDVTAGLGVAFDTTALALALSILLMFAQYYIERFENALLGDVDRRVEAELVGRFGTGTASPAGDAGWMRHVAQSLVESMENLVRRQADVWRTSLEASQQRWDRAAEGAGCRLQAALSAALAESLQSHAQRLAAAEESSAEKSRRQWAELQKTLAAHIGSLAGLQQALVEKAEILNRAVAGTEYVAQLEETLNRNLAALAGAKNFEETVLSLAAAIQLLSSRVGGAPAATPAVQLIEPARRIHKAA